ncbi:hypothetical protein DRQ23_01440 [bacterium]|nr:MAG: hypothetical protein DRQ23_01440 [bacterium]
MFFLFLSIVKMHIYSDKTTYLVGENIYVGCEITNTGSDVAYIEDFLFQQKLLSEDAVMWANKGRKIPHGILIGTPFRIAGRKYNKATKMLEPGETLRFKEKPIIGDYGNAMFDKRSWYWNNAYILPGRYSFTIYYWVKEKGRLKKLSSDTLHIYIQKPAGKEKKAWEIYKKFREKEGSWKVKEMIYLSKELIKKYPESAYLDELFYYWHHFSFVENWESKNPEMKREINETKRERRELLNLIKENIKKYKGRTQKEALWAIIQGEMVLGTPVEEINSFVINSGVLLDKEIRDYLGIEDKER